MSQEQQRKIYNINFFELSNLLTPPFFRKQKFIDWIYCLLSPLSIVNRDFNKFRSEAIYKLSHNSQVYSLEKVLNDYFDQSNRRIYIDDSFRADRVYIYPEADNREVYINENDNPVYIYKAETVASNVDTDFVVYIPKDLKPPQESDLKVLTVQIEAQINYYKLASKNYVIEWI